jgi:hypothetical protein
MKIILSRKGFDAKYGGVASPIFPNGRIRSLPIPGSSDNIRYDNLKFDLTKVGYGSKDIGTLVEELTYKPRKGKSGIKRTAFCHLDPDLIRTDLHRGAGWLPMYGQSNAAATHLLNSHVGVGDLFLFFGWFHRVHETDGCFSFDPERLDVHLLFGWLQIGEIWCEFSEQSSPTWARYHPHIAGRADKHKNLNRPTDAVFIANRWLDLPGLRMRRPGGGVFRKYHPDLCLTELPRTRGHWELPSWMYPSPEREPSMTYNVDRRKWNKNKAHSFLHSADIGQEFILDCAGIPEAKVNKWLTRLFAHAD